jgi:Putative prokaryotic signal transducing protein
MAITNPIPVYNAKDNIEAHIVRNYLEQNGIDAYVTRDDSLGGIWMFGLLPEIHKPQVWVDRSNLDAAFPLLQQFENVLREQHRQPDVAKDGASELLKATCEDCDKTSEFPTSSTGTVQDCPHCGAYIDVGDAEIDDFDS